MNNRERFNAAAIELGLTVTQTSSDGWHSSFTRADGLHIWTIRGGIQTAWIVNGRYAEHRIYHDSSFCPVEGLRAACKREPRKQPRGKLAPLGK